MGSTNDFLKMARLHQDEFVDLKPEMNYEEAISLIHEHILNLDI